MASTQHTKEHKKLSATDSAQKIKTKKRARTTVAPLKAKISAEITPISKNKEWKLLYTPYPFRTTDNSTSPHSSSRIRSGMNDKESHIYKGLCKSCKKHETCILPKPEGGVWRCEEYD